MTPIEVAEFVQKGLNKHVEAGASIRVVEAPELKDGQWQVLVEPELWEPTPRFRYYEMLGAVEDELSDERRLSVFLTPAPEAIYPYEIDGETIEVRRRTSVLFVTPKPRQEVHAVYELDGSPRSWDMVVPVSHVGSRVDEPWADRFARAVQRYLSDKRQRDEREQALAAFST